MSSRAAVALAVVATALAFAFSLSSALVLEGAGATFPEPLYRRFLVEFGRTKPLATVRYRGVGSFAGLRALGAGEAAFAGADVVLDDAQVDEVVGGGPVVEIPVCAGAVVAPFHIDGVDALRLDAHALAGLFLGRITRWDDPALAALNPGVALPHLAVTPVVRGDESGTSFVFTRFLADHDDAFARAAGATPKMHAADGARAAAGSAAVVAAVAQTNGAIGYVEERFAAEAQLRVALVQNDAGAFVAADVPAMKAAVSAALADVHDTRVGVVVPRATRDAAAYPIVGFSYVVVFRDLHNLRSADEAKALAQYLWWASHDGQALVERLRFAPVPATVRPDIEAALGALTWKGAAPVR